MPRRFSPSTVIPSHRVCFPFSFSAIAACSAHRPGPHRSRSFRRHLNVVVMVALFAACGVANAQPVAAAQST